MDILMVFILEFLLWDIDLFFWVDVYSVDTIDGNDTVVFRNGSTYMFLSVIVANVLEYSCWLHSLWGHCFVPHRCSFLWPAGFRIPCVAALDGRENVFRLKSSCYFCSCTCSKKVCHTWWQTSTKKLTFWKLWVAVQDLKAGRVSEEVFCVMISIIYFPHPIPILLFYSILFSVASMQGKLTLLDKSNFEHLSLTLF